MAKKSLAATIRDMNEAKVTATPGNASMQSDPGQDGTGRDPGKHGNDPKARGGQDAIARDSLLTDPEQKNREVAATTKRTKTKGRKADKAGGEAALVKQGSSGKNVTTGKTVAASEDGGTNTSRAAGTGGETAVIKQGSSDVRTVKQKEDVDTDEDLELLDEDEEEEDEDLLEISDEIVDLVNDLDEDELRERYAEVLAILDEEQDDEDYDDDDFIEEEAEETISEIRRRITADDIDVSDDVNALLVDEGDLSEDFQVKAKTIFEAAVVARVNGELDRLEEAFKTEFADALDAYEAELSEKIDSYLGYVVEEWLTENELAVDRGLQAEITEAFISGLKVLFAEHYIDVPEDQLDVLEALADENDGLRSHLNEAIETNIDNQKDAAVAERYSLLHEACDDLADTEASKLVSLAEGVTFEDGEQFTEALNILKESYFTDGIVPAAEEDVDEELAKSLEEAETVLQGSMAQYSNALGRQKN